MLKSLLIENYALIEKLDISFDDGLTIITGETGAGKSILLGALGLILGHRADTRVLHNKDNKCIIEGVFWVKDLQMEDLFTENDLDFEETTILRREITPQGKSRAFINDTPVNLNVIKLFAERLIDIHSQHQSLLFSDSSFRYNLLDAFAGITTQLTSFRKDYSRYTSARKELDDMLQLERQSRAELDYNMFQFDELVKASLIPDEAEEIARELEVLNHAGEIKYNLEKADYLILNSPQNLLSSVSEVVNLFRPLEKYEPFYAELFQRLQSVSIELKDIATEVAGKKEDISDDPVRTNKLQQRLDLLQKLMHKHNVSDINELIHKRDEFGSRIESFHSLESDVQKLTSDCDKQYQTLVSQAEQISAMRLKAVSSLEVQINNLLKELGMPNGKFIVQLHKNQHLHLHGIDTLDFLFTANLGAQPQELSKVASGGELSRLMLAVKSVISLKNLLPTIIFDEIDSGVSGEIGFKMGNILSQISNNMQVISVTHLPQVAARGKKHFVVYKNTLDHSTRTYVKEVSSQERVLEIAQMLGGKNPGPALLQAAEELFYKQNININ